MTSAGLRASSMPSRPPSCAARRLAVCYPPPHFISNPGRGNGGSHVSTTETKTRAASEAEAPDVDRVLMQLLAGAWVTQAIATAARLGIPDALASGPKTVDEIAAKAGTNRGATKRL